MRAPNGNNITVLVNATPISDPIGDVESFIVTLQDMTLIDELHTGYSGDTNHLPFDIRS